MCGRFAQTKTLVDLINKYRFLVTNTGSIPVHYNIAPTNLSPVFHEKGMDTMRWGLIPHWAKDMTGGARLINARAETVIVKPSFRSAFRKRRCLVPASGFYEWKKEAGIKTPYYIFLKDNSPLVFAGLYEEWRSPNGTEVLSFSVITCPPNDLMKPIHDRMPVIMDPDTAERWLEAPTETQEEVRELEKILQPYTTEDMDAYPVSTIVNKPGNNTSACIEPCHPEVQGELF